MLSDNKKSNVKKLNYGQEVNNNPIERPKKSNNKIIIDSKDSINNLNNINNINTNKKDNILDKLNNGKRLKLKNEEVKILEPANDILDFQKRESKTTIKNKPKNKEKDVRENLFIIKEEKNPNMNEQKKYKKLPSVEQKNQIEKSKQKISINCIKDNANEKDLIIEELKNKIKEYEEEFKMYQQIESKFKIENNNILKELEIYKDENNNLKKEFETLENKNIILSLYNLFHEFNLAMFKSN